MPVRFSARHVYNQAGRWTFMVNPITKSRRTPAVTSALFGTIDIAPGVSTAQSPTLPKVRVAPTTRPSGHEEDFSWVALSGEPTEDDGLISAIEVDWGDGSNVLVLSGGDRAMSCQPTPSGWPRSSWRYLLPEEAVHHYARSGNYTITLTGVSTACDGSETQRSSARMAWQVPGRG